MKVGFEAKRLFTNFTGLGNYNRFVVDALATYQPENSYLLYTPRTREHNEIKAVTQHPNVSVVTPPSIYKNVKATSLWRSWGVSFDSSIKTLDVFHGLSQEIPYGLPKRIKKVVTVHDLIYIRYPQFYNPIDVAIYKAKAIAACKMADVVIAISQQTANDLIEFLKVDEQKIRVVYQGCHPIFKTKKTKQEIDDVRRKYSLPERYILNVGTIEERKNVLLAVKALALISPEDRIPLVIVGRSTPYTQKVILFVEEKDLSSWVTFIHNASFTDFPAIYQGADIFVYPSLFEGFGIPLIEAIESGVPVITSTGSCFSEAAGPDAVYVDPDNAEELARHFSVLLAEKHRRDEIRNLSSAYITRFEPSVIADNLHHIYIM